MARLVHEQRPAQGDAEGLLVLHHGRGTDERDLLGLADALDPRRRLHVVSPRAPLQLPGSPGYHWYLVPRVGYPDRDTFHAAREALAELHDGLWERDRDRAGPHRPRRLLDGGGDELRDGALGAIGRRSPGSSPSAASSRSSRTGSRSLEDRRDTAVFIAHGRSDPIMEIGFARRARELLDGGGLEVAYRESEVGHQIDPRDVPIAAGWLTQVIE